MSAFNRVQRIIQAPRRLVGDEVMDMMLDSDFECDDVHNGSSDSDCESSGDELLENGGLGLASSSSLLDESVQQSEGTWCHIDRQPETVPFTGSSGIQCDISNVNSELDFFLLFVDQFLMDVLCLETNKYAAQKRASSMLGAVRLRKWIDTDTSELKQFIAIIFAMGVLDKPTYASYWTKDNIFSTPFFPTAMARDRFLLLMSALHVNDNTTAVPRGRDGFDRLHKVRPLIDHCSDKFGSVYKPERCLAIDETMVPWTGRLSFKQYIPIKPEKYGIKLFQVCESTTGYSCIFQVYAGKDDTRQPDPGQTITERVVLDLMAPFLNKGHCLFMDNYYSSVKLYETLLAQGTTACGTLRLNRKGLPDDIKTTKLKKGEHMFRRKEDLLVLKWHDKKVVTFMSTAHSASFHENTKGKSVPVVKSSYDRHMNGVDINDQNVGYYAMKRKAMKWYKKMIIYCLNLCRFQSFVIFRKSGKGDRISHLEFTQRLVFQLMERAGAETASRQPVAAIHNRLNCTGNHFPEVIPATEKKKYPTKRCVVCSADAVGKKRKVDHAVRHETRYVCMSCQVPLCISPRPCFRHFHTLVNYKPSNTAVSPAE